MESDEESSRCAHLATSIQQLGVMCACAGPPNPLLEPPLPVVLAILRLLHAANAAIWLLQRLRLLLLLIIITALGSN